MKRTTVLLDDDDEETLEWVAKSLKATKMEAIRRSLRHMMVSILRDEIKI